MLEKIFDPARMPGWWFATVTAMLVVLVAACLVHG